MTPADRPGSSKEPRQLSWHHLVLIAGACAAWGVAADRLDHGAVGWATLGLLSFIAVVLLFAPPMGRRKRTVALSVC